MEVRRHRQESIDNQELFDDFAALPDQFRPKKTPKAEPTVVPKTGIWKENSSNSSNVNTSAMRSYGKSADSNVSKSVVHDNNRMNALQGRPSTSPQKNFKEPSPKDGTLLQAHAPVLKKDVAGKKNASLKEQSLIKKFSQLSFESAHFPESNKVHEKVWNNDLLIETEPQVWKFNGSTLEPEKTDTIVATSEKRTGKEGMKYPARNGTHRTYYRRGMGLKKKIGGWDDSLDLFVDNKVNFGYVSQETKNGSSTITACWGDIHQTRPLRPVRQNFVPRKSYYKPRNFEKLPQPKHEETMKRCPTSTETKPLNQHDIQNQHDVKGKQRHRSKNVKTSVIRHEIKVIHVNEKGELLSGRGDAPKMSKRADSWENVAPLNLKSSLFTFGTKVGMEDSRISQSKRTVPKSGTKENPPSGVKEKSVHPKTPSKSSKKDEKSENLEDSKRETRESFLRFGREISDLVIGGYFARSMLVALYEKWIPVRNKTIELMETLAENVVSSRNKNKKVQNVVDLLQSGSQMACAFPNIKVTIVARIIAAITPFISMLFKSSPSISQTGMTETEMMNQIQDDIEATLEVYMYGTQCDQQFREVCGLFENFQDFIDINDFSDFTGPEADFVRDISFFSPKNLIVYYRRLNRCIEKLIESQTSGISSSFCRGFEGNAQAISTVQLLHWRFVAQIEDCEAFQRAWKEVSRVLESSNSDTEVMEEIRDCINILRKERRTIENNLAELRENLE